jgi:hypothetical protein
MQAPDGLPWRVERHWMPRWGGESPLTRHRRGMRVVGKGADAASGFGDLGMLADLPGPFAIIGLIFIVVAVVAFLGFVFVPLLLVVVDLAVVLLLAAALLLGRVLFRRPWTVEAIDPQGTSQEWKVVGWRASRELKADLRRRIEAGLPLPDPDPTGGVVS